MLNAHRNKSDSFLNFINFVEEGGASHELKDAHINWLGNFDRANQLGIGSIIYHRMKQGGMLQHVPEEIVEQSKARYYWNQARNMKRFARLREVLGAFSSAQIPVIALKGAALAEHVYPQMGLRPMADVDLLVHEEDLTNAEQLLVSLGFHANEGNHPREWFRTHHHHLVPYVSSDGSLIIELHHRLIALEAPIAIPNNDLWERARFANISGVECRILSPEDLLMHLSLHMAVDAYFGKVRVLYDLRETIRHYQKEIDWDTFINIAKAYRISKYLYYAFWLAKVTVRAEVPTQVLSTLRSHFCGLPFEDHVVKGVIQKVIVLHEANKHPFYVWILRTACLDILSNQARIEKLQNIIHRSIQRYRNFSQKHAQKAGVSPGWYFMVGYPVYMIRKAVGLSTSLEKTQGKKS